MSSTYRYTENLRAMDEMGGTAVDRHFARSMHEAVRGYDGYDFGMVTSAKTTLFFDVLDKDAFRAIEEAGGEVAGIDLLRDPATIRVYVVPLGDGR